MANYRLETPSGNVVYVLHAEGRAHAKAVCIGQGYDVASIRKMGGFDVLGNSFIETVLQAYDLEY